MKGPKTTTTQQQSYSGTNSYGYMTPPETADVQKLRDFKFTADPRIGYAFGSAKNKIANSFNNPIGGVYSPQIRDAILRSQYAQLAQGESQAQSEAGQSLQGQQWGQQAAIAGLTSPRLVQTGSSGTSSGQNVTQQQPDIMGQILSGASTAAMI